MLMTFELSSQNYFSKFWKIHRTTRKRVWYCGSLAERLNAQHWNYVRTSGPRAWKILQSEYLVAKLGFHAAENEPSKIWQEFAAAGAHPAQPRLSPASGTPSGPAAQPAARGRLRRRGRHGGALEPCEDPSILVPSEKKGISWNFYTFLWFFCWWWLVFIY